MKKDVLIVDCQVFQSGAKDRGMGKYTYELLNHLGVVANQNFSEVIFLFNSSLDVNENVEKMLTKQFINGKIEHLHLDLANNLVDTGKVLKKNKNILNRYIVKSKFVKPKYLIPSLFLYEICPAFPDNATKLLLFYDLIPYLYFERYEQSEATYDQNYLERFNIVFEADVIYTISETVANDMSIFIGIPQDRLFNIDGSAVKRKHLSTKKPKAMNQVPGDYILMPSGEDLRKNNMRGVKGFKAFNDKHKGKYRLIITSTFTEETKKKLRDISKNVIFSGDVSEEELAWLYKNCASVYFPTEYEGLGMPILEGIDFNKPIACSNIAVFNEMSLDGFTYFDPHDEADMAQAIEESLSTKINSSAYKQISERFTWEESVKKLVKASREAQPNIKTAKQKKRIAVVCPDPTGFSAIGKVVMESHYVMTQYFDIDYYFEAGPNHRKIRVNLLPAVANCKNISELDSELTSKYEAVVYHVGNSEYHLQTVTKALTIPGIVIFHDTNLRGLYDSLHEHGYISDDRKRAEKKLDSLLNSKSKMIGSIANNQKAILCHSLYAKKAIEDVLTKNVPVSSANLPVSASVLNSQSVKKRHMNIGLAGILAEIKGTKFIDLLLESKYFNGAKIFLIGHTFLNDAEVKRLRGLKQIEFIGDPTDLEFQTYLSKLDILINYRERYNGETSLSTLEALRHGVVPVVRSIGWYSELPDEIIKKAKTSNEVLPLVRSLIKDEQLRVSMSTEAQKIIHKDFNHYQYSEALLSLIDQQ